MLGAFALGCVITSWLTQRPSAEKSPESPHVVAAATASSADAASIEIIESVGIPPDSVTPARPAPNAGQRRALARALDGLEQRPPIVESKPVDPQAAADFRDALRAALTQENLP